MYNRVQYSICARRAPVLSLFSFLYPRARFGPVRISVDGERVDEYRDPPELERAFTSAPELSADEKHRESELLRSATDAARRDADDLLEVPLYQLAYTRWARARCSGFLLLAFMDRYQNQHVYPVATHYVT